jgi:hypothetical protein
MAITMAWSGITPGQSRLGLTAVPMLLARASAAGTHREERPDRDVDSAAVAAYRSSVSHQHMLTEGGWFMPR